MADNTNITDHDHDDDAAARLATSGSDFLACVANSLPHIVQRFPPPTTDSEDHLDSTQKSVIETRKCLICTEAKPISETYEAVCNDVYCHDCLRRLFTDFVQGSSTFPPRCCCTDFAQNISLAIALPILGQELLDRVEQKVLEQATNNKTYC